MSELWQDLEKELYFVQALQHSVRTQINSEWIVDTGINRGANFAEMLRSFILYRGINDLGNRMLEVYIGFTKPHETLRPTTGAISIVFIEILIDGMFYSVPKGQIILNTLCTQIARLGFTINDQKLNSTPTWKDKNKDEIVGEFLKDIRIRGSSTGISTARVLEFLDKTWDYLVAIRHPWVQFTDR